jgi:putative transposase
MARRRHTPDQNIRKLREADRLLGEGAEIADIARHLEVSEQTYHRWRNQLGGMKTDDARRLKHLERENARLSPRLPIRRHRHRESDRDPARRRQVHPPSPSPTLSTTPSTRTPPSPAGTRSSGSGAAPRVHPLQQRARAHREPCGTGAASPALVPATSNRNALGEPLGRVPRPPHPRRTARHRAVRHPPGGPRSSCRLADRVQHYRLHSALGMLKPVEFADHWRQTNQPQLS